MRTFHSLRAEEIKKVDFHGPVTTQETLNVPPSQPSENADIKPDNRKEQQKSRKLDEPVNRGEPDENISFTLEGGETRTFKKGELLFRQIDKRERQTLESIKAGDWLVEGYDIFNDKRIARVFDAATFRQIFSQT